jgi:hypothetical protein
MAKAGSRLTRGKLGELRDCRRKQSGSYDFCFERSGFVVVNGLGERAVVKHCQRVRQLGVWQKPEREGRSVNRTERLYFDIAMPTTDLLACLAVPVVQERRPIKCSLKFDRTKR